MDKKSNEFPLLKTGRLILRQLTNQDINEIHILRSDPGVNMYLDRSLSQTIEDSSKFITAINSGYNEGNMNYWAITTKDSENLVGTICLFDINDTLRSGEIGFELLPEFQNNGYMTEAVMRIIEFAFQSIGLAKIVATVHRSNQSSLRVLEKLNFKLVDTGSEENHDLLVFHLNENLSNR